MKKEISFSSQGYRADIGRIPIHRILPNRYADAVGPFVFLDHLGPFSRMPGETLMQKGTGAHPHRGIATLTYVLNGEGEHFDSRGNHAKVFSGGVQWMKAGNGIIHDETINPDSRTDNPSMHGFQFWINLPAKVKIEAPEYLSVHADEVLKMMLSEDRGWLKVIAGAYENLVSKIPAYSKQYLYHIHLNEGKQFSMPTEKGLEYAAFLPLHEVIINDTTFDAGEFIEFDRQDGTIEIANTSGLAADIILFGGEPYAEPITAQGPFVMNTMQEIAEAYKDFHSGKYGKITYVK
ncbi:pirin family protein [Chitinophaga tropicalis]|uniref:Pirin family protein n=1 Tax=Chitinophaga tropicalis TaxID=2683588 RepID=A0A7K1U0W1_9BACT|nr:pirin family protein [Chitinophaga tropicalis]MVT07983.1 pirin family protein [Chitinophaga tropicalis]